MVNKLGLSCAKLRANFNWSVLVIMVWSVDYDAPVLTVVKPGKSYFFIQFFTTTISTDDFNALQVKWLPKHWDGKTFLALDVPQTIFASIDASSSCRFTDKNKQAQESCVHAFLGMGTTALNSQCQSTEFPNKKLIRS